VPLLKETPIGSAAVFDSILTAELFCASPSDTTCSLRAQKLSVRIGIQSRHRRRTSGKSLLLLVRPRWIAPVQKCRVPDLRLAPSRLSQIGYSTFQRYTLRLHMRGRFHDDVFGLLIEQHADSARVFGYCQNFFRSNWYSLRFRRQTTTASIFLCDIIPPPIGHSSSWPGTESVLRLLKRVEGDRPLHQRNNDCQLFVQTRSSGSEATRPRLSRSLDSADSGHVILALNCHEVRGPVGPKGTAMKSNSDSFSCLGRRTSFCVASPEI